MTKQYKQSENLVKSLQIDNPSELITSLGAHKITCRAYKNKDSQTH